MPHRLKQRQEKIQNKRKQTPWREFVKEIASWQTFSIHRNNTGNISRYLTDRVTSITPTTFEEERDKYLDYGIAYDNNLSFLSSIKELLSSTPLPHMMGGTSSENCDYSDVGGGSKNCYLSFYFVDSENVLYSFNCKESTNVINSCAIRNNSSNIYYSLAVDNSHNIFYSQDIESSSNIYFSSDMKGCHECILCTSQKNKKYMIKNTQYTPEEYKRKKQSLLQSKLRFLDTYNTINTGSNTHILLSENTHNAYIVHNLENGNNVAYSGGMKSKKKYFDVFASGAGEDFYGVYQGSNQGNNIYCSIHVAGSSNIYYSGFLRNCSHCLGCIGLKNKSYCILNKQYTKEERYDKVDEIFTQMEKDGTLGKFFPGSMNPFYFNDTAAYLIDDSFTKEEVEAEGYLRRDEKIKVDIPEGAEIVYVGKSHPEGNEGSSTHKIDSSLRSEGQLDEYQGRKVNGKFYPISEIGNKVPKVESGAERWIDPEILKKVIKDNNDNYYRIVKIEYDFLMKHGLPLPRLHWLDRIKLGFTFK